MSDPVLSALFLFNHRFERNVPVLEELYKDRFSRRRYVMPFATIERPDVIPVREAGFYFHGHLAQAADRFLDDEVTHYVVISDDLFVNPKLNEHNLLAELGLGERAAWIKSLAGADEVRYGFTWAADAAFQMQRAQSMDLLRDLPPAEDAQRRFEAMGFHFPRPRPRSLAELRHLTITMPRQARLIWWESLALLGRRSPYPLLMGYADFLVLPAHGIARFLHYCGLFAAMNIFVEIALPTALALAYDEIVTEMEIGEDFRQLSARRRPDAPYKGIELADSAPFGESRGWSRDRLVEEFPDDWLYAHPVKFSQWT